MPTASVVDLNHNITLLNILYSVETVNNHTKAFCFGNATTPVTGKVISRNPDNKSSWVGIKVDGENLIGVTAEKIPSLNSIKKTYKSKSSNKNKTAAQQKKEINKLSASTESQILKKALNKFKSELRVQMASIGHLEKRISVSSGASRDITVEFHAFGYVETFTTTVVGGDSSVPVEPEDSETKTEYLSIASVNNGVPYLIKEDAFKKYGWIEKVIDFSDIDDAATLKNLGEIYLSSLQFDEMNLEVSAVDLHYLSKDIAGLNLLDNVHCISKIHGLDKYFPITKMEIPLDKPDQIKYTLGDSGGAGGMTVSVNADSKKFMNQLRRQTTKASILDSAKAAMSQLMNDINISGFVNIIQESSTSQAIVISDNEDWTKAQKLWKFDMNGLSYSPKKLIDMTENEKRAMEEYTGHKITPNELDPDARWYKIGMTMDGQIVADMISTGILSDGYGYNYWNLNTGEFSLAGNTQLGDYTLNEVVDYATNGGYQQTGGTNYLHGTLDLKLNGNGTWGTYEWRPHAYQGPNGARTPPEVKDITGGKPTPVIDKMVTFGKYGGSIAQIGMVISTNTAYVISYYVRRTSENNSHTCSLSPYAIPVYEQEDLPSNVKWQCCGSDVLDLNGNPIIASNTQVLGQIEVSGWVRVYRAYRIITDTKISRYGTVTIGGTNIQIAGLKMEKGNTPTDWQASQDDIYKDVRDLTEDQAKAFKTEFFTQERILNTLTNRKNSSDNSKGMWLTNGELYLNATFIQTGMLSDHKGNTKWNLNDGTLLTRNIIIRGGEFSTYGNWINGIWVRFPNGQNILVRRQPVIGIQHGALYFQWNLKNGYNDGYPNGTRYVTAGSIAPTWISSCAEDYRPGWTMLKALNINGDGGIVLTGERIYVGTHSTRAREARSLKINMKVCVKAKLKRGKLITKYKKLNMEFCNGLLIAANEVSVGEYDTSNEVEVLPA